MLQKLPPVLEVRDLSTDYLIGGGLSVHAVEEVSFSLRRGEVLGIVGESGCGKTTLIRSLLRLLPAEGRIVGGSIKLDGIELLALSEKKMAKIRWDKVAIIFQGAANALNPVRKVGDQIAEALAQCRDVSLKKDLNVRVSELLKYVGISPGRQNQYPHQFSVGMLQRVVIAMALACYPQIIIADEPTSALDVMVQAQILELLDRLRDDMGLTIIFVTHDVGIVAELCDSVMVMYAGVLAEYADVDTIYNNPQHPYTQELLRTFPDINSPTKVLATIPGYPPPLDDLPTGCRFAPRCPMAMAICHEQVPTNQRLAAEHLARCHKVTPSQVNISTITDGN